MTLGIHGSGSNLVIIQMASSNTSKKSMVPSLKCTEERETNKKKGQNQKPNTHHKTTMKKRVLLFFPSLQL